VASIFDFRILNFDLSAGYARTSSEKLSQTNKPKITNQDSKIL